MPGPVKDDKIAPRVATTAQYLWLVYVVITAACALCFFLAGMSPYEVLVTGTRNVGEYFANEDDFGTVAPGKRADLVLLRANPLEDVGNVDSIEGVMVAGRWLPRAEIDRRLQTVADGYAGQEIQ